MCCRGYLIDPRVVDRAEKTPAKITPSRTAQLLVPICPWKWVRISFSHPPYYNNMEIVVIPFDDDVIVYEEWSMYMDQLIEAEREEWINSIGWGD
jgi:hypothetical protein